MAEFHHPEAETLRLVDVLAALGHPVRIAIVQALASGDELSCGEILPEEPKSSKTHHWRALREAGVLHQRREGRRHFLTLRREELESRFPGLLDIVFAQSAETKNPA
ncbi:ArsR/SmtB family transcription factor [Nocardia thraciensis]